jgi:hypothetical protein
VSQRLPITALESVVSNAERRAVLNGETPVVPRVSDVYAALPSITGKIELEYEGELQGAETVARDWSARPWRPCSTAAQALNTRTVITWFENGGRWICGHHGGGGTTCVDEVESSTRMVTTAAVAEAEPAARAAADRSSKVCRR